MPNQRKDLPAVSRRTLLRGAAAVGAAAALASAGGWHAPAAAAPEIPKTMAGRKLASWMAAFNAADTNALLDFHHANAEPNLAVMRATCDLIVRRTWGTVSVNRVVESTEDRILALLRTSLTQQWPQIEIGGPTGLAFDRALRGNRLLNPAYTKLVLSGKVDGGFESEGRYGYGFQEITLNGHQVAGHSGTSPGASCSLNTFTERGITAVVLANYDAIGGPVIRKIRRLVLRG